MLAVNLLFFALRHTRMLWFGMIEWVNKRWQLKFYKKILFSIKIRTISTCKCYDSSDRVRTDSKNWWSVRDKWSKWLIALVNENKQNINHTRMECVLFGPYLVVLIMKRVESEFFSLFVSWHKHAISWNAIKWETPDDVIPTKADRTDRQKQKNESKRLCDVGQCTRQYFVAAPKSRFQQWTLWCTQWRTLRRDSSAAQQQLTQNEILNSCDECVTPNSGINRSLMSLTCFARFSMNAFAWREFITLETQKSKHFSGNPNMTSYIFAVNFISILNELGYRTSNTLLKKGPWIAARSGSVTDVKRTVLAWDFIRYR